MSIKKHCRS